MSTTAPTRPVLRYHGGKWRLASWVLEHFPAHRVYTEVYGGAASVLMQKPRSYGEVYNDLDGEVVNVFRVLRDPETAGRLKEILEQTPFAREEFQDAYLPTDDPVEFARRTIIKAYMGYGSAGMFADKPKGMRTSSSRWSTPNGFRGDAKKTGSTPASDWVGYPDQIPLFVDRLQGVVIEHRAALDVLKTHDDSNALHYVDPPYLGSTRGSSRITGRGGTFHAYRHELEEDDHRELAEFLKRLRGFVVVSGYRSDLYDELFDGWSRYDRDHYADGAKARVESLWLSPRTDEARVHLFDGR